MEKAIQSLDLDTNLGMVTLSDGQKVAIPKLSVGRLLELVKFIGIVGAKLYTQFQEIINDAEIDDMEKFITVLESLSDEQLVKVFAILLDISEKDALSLDINEMLEIILVYTEKVDLNKTFLLCRTLAKNILRKEMPPTMSEWIQSLFKKQAPQQMGTETQKVISTGLRSPIA